MMGENVWKPTATLPETNSKFAPKKRAGRNPKGNYVVFFSRPFSGAFAVGFREGISAGHSNLAKAVS